ncbi:MAG: sterol desaturase family protein, partial [Mariprofundaceae bacterium]
MEAEATVRLSVLFGMLAAMAIWETVAPKRRQQIPKARRWMANLGIVALNTLLLRLLMPASTMGAAALAEAEGWGMFHLIDLPTPVAIVAAVVLLDCAIYWQHAMFHAVPVLWRLHKVHHADVEIDVSTGLRFHPVEIMLSMLIKMTVVLMLAVCRTYSHAHDRIREHRRFWRAQANEHQVSG